MAVNIRLGKEEEEALHRKGNGDNTTTTATVEVGVEGEKERRGRSLFNGPSHSKLVSFIVTILSLHLFHYSHTMLNGLLLGGPVQELDPSGGTAQLFGGKHTLATLVPNKVQYLSKN